MRYFLLLCLLLIKYQNCYSQNLDDFYFTDSIDFENECVRAIPEPILDTLIFPNSEFMLINYVGFEKVNLKNGDTLIIRNCGCETYSLVFRFEIGRDDTRIDNYDRWYRVLVKQLSMIENAVKSPINIEEAKFTLINYIDNYNNQPLKIGEIISIEDGTIPEMMRFDKVLPLDNDRVGLELSVWIGPL